MNSEEISLISTNLFIRKFVFAIIQNIRARNFAYEERHVIHADLVPRVSERVMRASLKERVVSKVPEKVVLNPVVVASIIRDQPVHAPVIMPLQRIAPPPIQRRMMPARLVSPPIQHRMIVPLAPPVQSILPPIVPKGVPSEPSQDYGRIQPLLNDPSISTIECQGADKPVMIIRAGQRQPTKIVLTADDIKSILKKASDAAHVPLLEGVFRVAVDNFSINAVISGIVGSRFVIKKATAYNLLEK